MPDTSAVTAALAAILRGTKSADSLPGPAEEMKWSPVAAAAPGSKRPSAAVTAVRASPPRITADERRARESLDPGNRPAPHIDAANGP